MRCLRGQETGGAEGEVRVGNRSMTAGLSGKPGTSYPGVIGFSQGDRASWSPFARPARPARHPANCYPAASMASTGPHWPRMRSPAHPALFCLYPPVVWSVATHPPREPHVSACVSICGMTKSVRAATAIILPPSHKSRADLGTNSGAADTSFVVSCIAQAHARIPPLPPSLSSCCSMLHLPPSPPG